MIRQVVEDSINTWNKIVFFNKFSGFFEAERKGEIGRNYQFTAWNYFTSYMIREKKKTTTNDGWICWVRMSLTTNKIEIPMSSNFVIFWRCDVNFIIAYISNYQSLGISQS